MSQRLDASYDDSRAEEALAKADEEFRSPNQSSVPSMTLEQAVSMLNLRKQNLDHIYEPTTITAQAIIKIREDELERVLEILSQVRS